MVLSYYYMDFILISFYFLFAINIIFKLNTNVVANHILTKYLRVRPSISENFLLGVKAITRHIMQNNHPQNNTCSEVLNQH